jgi:exodeoxyribonuclease VIII
MQDLENEETQEVTPYVWTPGDPAVVLDLPDEVYHASNGVSKSKIWDIETKTPFLARYGAHKPAQHFTFGHAAHLAVLEPDTVEERVMRGPMSETNPHEEARTNSNVWKRAVDAAAYAHQLLLKPSDYDLLMMIRDLAGSIPELELMREVDDQGRGPMVEASCYGVDEETGLVVRCRPDIYNPRHKLMVDLKNLTDASQDGWERDVGKFGYHMQDAAYEQIWGDHSGMEVEGFWFLCFEKSEPPQVALYELDAATVKEGHDRWRRGLKRWKECEDNGHWPSYPTGVRPSSLRQWDYQINPAPEK